MEFRRGFKSECERLAAELRGELGLKPADALNPHDLAAHLAIGVISLAEFAASDATAVQQLVARDRGCFSAMTIFCGSKRLIVYNPSHPPGRPPTRSPTSSLT